VKGVKHRSVDPHTWAMIAAGPGGSSPFPTAVSLLTMGFPVRASGGNEGQEKGRLAMLTPAPWSMSREAKRRPKVSLRLQ
jgi:hypothetical protein